MIALLAAFHFLRPWWLVLGPLAIWLWWRWQRRTDPLRGWRAQMDADLLTALVVGERQRSPWPRRAVLGAWLLAVLAIAGPTWRPEPAPFADDATPLMLVLKAGETMQQQDLAPSRLERARLKVADFATERKGQPLGLIAYAGSAHLVLPPTRDTSVVATMAAEISPAIMPEPGDNLAAALREADRVLRESGGGAAVVLADTVSGDVGALVAFRKASRTPVHFLAIDQPESVEAENLQAAAKALSGRVVALTPTPDDVRALVRRVAETPAAAVGAGEGQRWEEAGYWLTPVIALVVLGSFRREKRMEVPA
jgi:Ca-activated chloride channel family protein